MTAEIEKLQQDPPDEEKVFAEIGRTILAIQPTEQLFNIIAAIVLPDQAPTVDNIGILTGHEKAKTLGQLKDHTEKKLGVPFDATFLNALGTFVENRNKLIHRIHDVPDWDLKTPKGRIAAFCFLKFMQGCNLELRHVLLGLIMAYDKKHFFGVVGSVNARYDLWPEAEFYEQIAKEVFGLEGAKKSD